MGSRRALLNTPHLESRKCTELGGEADQAVPDQTTCARRARQAAEMREELENINTRVNNAVQAFELASSRLRLERAHQTNVEFVEDVTQLDAILSDRETRRKYQQRVCVFIVGYRTACGQRSQLLSQLSEFFSQHSAMIEEEISSPVEKVELEDVSLKVTDALNSAEQGILKLAELNKEINKYISTATLAKDPKGGRKKLEKTINQAKENIMHLRKKLKETQTELEAKDKKFNELLKQSEARLQECQYFQSQLDITQKSVRNLSQGHERRKKLLEQEVKEQAARITELQSMLREVQAEKEQILQQVSQETRQLPAEIPEGEDFSDEEGRAAEREKVETPGLLEDLMENSHIRMSGIQRDVEADVAELQEKLEKHQITLQEAQRELLEIQVYQLEKVRKTHNLERKRLRGYHQRQIMQLLGPDAENRQELDWISEMDRYSDADWPDSEESSENKEDTLHLDTQRTTSRTSSDRESGRLSNASARGTEEITRGELQQLEREDLKPLAGGVKETQESCGPQFEPVDESVTSQPMAECVALELEPMAECVGSEDERVKECVGSEDERVEECVGSEDERVKEGVGSEDERVKECVGSEDERVEECVGSEDERVEECVGSEDERVKECVGSEDERVEECVGSESERVKECVGSEDERVEECVGSEDERVEECVGSEDERVEECVGSEDERVEECVGSESERVKECVGSEDERVKEGVGSEDERVKECVGSESERVKECVGSEDERVEECVGSEDERVEECVGSEDERVEECVGSESERVEECVGSESERVKECVGSEDERVKECVGSEDERVKECVGSEDERVKECVGSEDERVEECVGSEDERVEECVGSEDERVKECVGSEDERVKECVGSEDERVEECVGSEDEREEECVGSEDERVEECVGSEDERVEECVGSEDERVEECVGSESAESSPSGRTPWRDITGLGVTAAELCDKSTQFPVGGGGESRDAGNARAAISAEGPQPGKASHPDSSHTEDRETSTSSSVTGSLRIYQTVNQVAETLREILLQKEMHALVQLLEVPVAYRSEGLLDTQEWLPIVTRRCDALLHGIMLVVCALLGADASPDALLCEADAMSLMSTAADESATGARRPTELTATPHRRQKHQELAADWRIDGHLTLSREQEEDKLRRATELNLQRTAPNCCGPESDGGAHRLPDHTTVFFTRLDLERNLRSLRQGLVCGRLPRNTYENVATVMERYTELQQERLSSLVKSYSSFVRTWEAMKKISAGEPSSQPVLTKMETLQNQRAQRWGKVNAQHSEQRLLLATVLTSTLKQVEAQSGIFLIKPVLSWKGRLDSTSKISTCRKHLPKKEQPSRLASTLPCHPIGLTGTEQILGQSLRILNRGRGEKLWQVNEAGPPPSASGEIAGESSIITTPRLLEMDVRRFLFNRHFRPTYAIRKEGVNPGVQKLGASFPANKPVPFSDGIRLSATDRKSPLPAI